MCLNLHITVSTKLFLNFSGNIKYSSTYMKIYFSINIHITCIYIIQILYYILPMLIWQFLRFEVLKTRLWNLHDREKTFFSNKIFDWVRKWFYGPWKCFLAVKLLKIRWFGCKMSICKKSMMQNAYTAFYLTINYLS